MLRVLILGALAVVSLATPILDVKLDKHWEMWKNYQNKAYSDKQEELKRRMIWEENFETINLHNLEHTMGKHTFTMGMNQFGDLKHEEYIEWNKLVKQPKKQMKLGNKFEHVNLDVPDTMDWRDRGYVTPVKDQGQCGSCWSFSATGSLEGQYFKAKQTLLSFSEQQLVDCSKPEGDYGCNGGLMDDAFKYIEQYKIETETDYPYEAQDDTCRADPNLGVTEVAGYIDVPQGSEDKLKKACGGNGPISVAIDASHQSFQFYKSGVYDEPDCSSEQLDHGVLAVGYGTDATTGLDYWLVKNSWNTVWGMDGYIMMSRNKNNQCGIASSASYPEMK